MMMIVSAGQHKPVVVPPSHHVLVGGGGRDLKPLDVFIGAKKEGVVPRCVVWRPHEETAHLANCAWAGEKGHLVVKSIRILWSPNWLYCNDTFFFFKHQIWHKRVNAFYPSSGGCRPLVLWSFHDTSCGGARMNSISQGLLTFSHECQTSKEFTYIFPSCGSSSRH